MFDNSPQSNSLPVIAGTNSDPRNTGERKAFHYIENIYDPDKHDVADLASYTVPQERELVFDVSNGIIYQVSHVDWEATLKTSLVPWTITNVDDGNTVEQDWIFGLRGGPMAGEALMCVDYSVRPNKARVDATIMRPGAAYAYVFMGDDVSNQSNIISAQYDQSGNMLNKQVPCQLAEIVDRTNLMIMTTGQFSVTKNAEALPEGSRCWLVFYDEGGNYIPPAQPLMVQHSSYMKDHQIGIKYVTGIELLSPWFTNSNDPENLIIPLNVNLLSLEFRALVHYSNGDPVEHPVNSNKFSLWGLREYRPTYPGQTGTLTLTYAMDEDEQFYIAEPGNPNHKSRTYTIEAGAIRGAYSPKIYTYPQWDASLVGYKLQHFLYDLDRQTLIDVTDKVTFNDQSPVYRPSLYGTAQALIFNLNLRDVSPTYESVIFIQHTEVVLLKDVNGPGTRWSVSYAANRPTYNAKKALVVNNGASTTFNLTNGFATQGDWLDGMYWAVLPSFDSRVEEKAPVPTHFDLMHEDGRRWRYSIAAWNQNNTIVIELQKGKSMFINWVNRDASGNELQLATTGVVVDFS